MNTSRKRTRSTTSSKPSEDHQDVEPRSKRPRRATAKGKVEKRQAAPTHLKGQEHQKKADGLLIEYKKGSLFNADDSSIFVHSCNCMGSWGRGIAAEFKKRFPEHFKKYRDLCSRRPQDLLGHGLLLGPHEPGIEQKRWVGCLFTRLKPGKVAASKAEADRLQTCENTTNAVEDILKQLQLYEQHPAHVDNVPGDIVMPKINAGLFGVPWEQTVEALSQVNVPKNSRHRQVTVYDPAKSDEDDEK